MGIPSFYRWLVTKYPKVVVNGIQEPTSEAISPNPNGIEFDNLYLDMNGIIHPCFHPDDADELHPTTFEEVFNSVFEYVDRLFNIVRPRKLIYFAIDGVSPRAKLNVQRAGRYLSAKNRAISEKEEKRLMSEYMKAGKKLLPKTESEVDDPNIISPGTEFMHDFSKALYAYIQTRLKENASWKNLKVILSDVNVPGEGEHKLMSFIRSQQSLPGYDVNTRHCIHGLDADLIMLALATHEPHISILREDVYGVKPDQPLNSHISIQRSPVRKSCFYQFVHIWILKEYLELDLQAIDVPEGFKFDHERLVDDFVFMCFFVGNDYLPHLPSLDVREEALDLLMTVYKRAFKSLGGYLTDVEKVNEPNGAYLNLERVEKFVHSLARYEDAILLKRTNLLERKMNRAQMELSYPRNCDASGMETRIHILYAENDDMIKNTQQLKEDIKRTLRENDDVFKTGLFPEDKIKYGTIGWKDRYYQEKFGFKYHLELESVKDAAVKYTEGLCWVLLYYFSSEIPSWSWHYPYHYGPCATDLRSISQLRVKFSRGVPFEPFDQLTALIPPSSVQILPVSYRSLMTDENSDIAYFYPREFEVDMVGKRLSWQGQCILPFIDEELLLRSTRKAKEELTEYEAERNSVKADLLFVRVFSDFGSELLSKIVKDPSGIAGVGAFANLMVQALDSSNGEDRILCVRFNLPKLNVQARACIMGNVDYPPRTVDESDVKEAVLWHEQNSRTRFASMTLRGRGASTLPASSSREGLYNHPNWSQYVENSNQTSSHRGSFRPQRSRLNENNEWASRRFASRDSSRDSGSSRRW